MEERKPLNKEFILGSFIENKDFLEKRYQDGVEKYRKGDFTIKFSGAGKKNIKVSQKKHKFLFGCNAFMLDSFEKPEKEEIYKEKFAKIFNQAVVPFYWDAFEPEEGKLRLTKDDGKIYRRPTPDIVLDFCNKYGIEPKGHCLLWNNLTPKWLKNYDEAGKKKIVERHFKEISELYGDKILSFDVINETRSNYRLGVQSLFEEYDEFGVMLGEKYFKNNVKIINETNEAIWKDYLTGGKHFRFAAQLKDFIQKGYQFDEIGLQYHAFGTSEELETYNLRFIYLDALAMVDILDILSKFDKPMHISEITIPGSGCNEENEEMQAIITEQLYKIWFATEKMKGIVWWNLVDGYAAFGRLGSTEGENRYGGGLMRFDMTEKPAYKVLDRLINKEWNTSFETENDTDTLSFRGFYGEYEITVNGKTYTVNFDQDKKEISL